MSFVLFEMFFCCYCSYITSDSFDPGLFYSFRVMLLYVTKKILPTFTTLGISSMQIFFVSGWLM